MITTFLRTLTGQLAVVAIAVSAVVGWVASIKSKAVTEERARVEKTERKIDEKAKAARRRAVSDADRVLQGYYRD
jgi:hypothetical protein